MSEDFLTLSNGVVVKSLAELINALKKMEDNIFEYHVSRSHNDFKDWIGEGYGDEKFAKKIGKIKKRDKMVKILEKRLGRVKGVGIVGTEKIEIPKSKKDILTKLQRIYDVV